ncbi:MAG: hypothetical protein C4523_15920 [Myxococcales bacterium]|nr:MAG: hypothetical protein C4523_15920 [Myxococcales bacterium]
MKIGDPVQYRWLWCLVGLIFILNVADGVLTLFWVFDASVEEWNPLLARLVKESPVLFMLVKIALVLLGSILLFRFRSNAYAVIGLFVAFMAYYYLLLYHLNAMNLKLVGWWFE